jgi:hypothetical protein
VEKIRKISNIIIPLLAIGAVLANSACDTGCTYLHGSLFGVDLNHLGILLAGVILAVSLPISTSRTYRQTADRARAGLLSFSIGGGLVLLHFQLVNSIFCLFCTIYGALLFILFLVNFNMNNRMSGPAMFFAGLLLFAFFFEGSAIPMFQF